MEPSDILPMLSVVVPTRNRAPLLSAALESLLNQSLSPHRYEVVVVDNGSTDTTKAVLDEAIVRYADHQLRYVYDPVPGLLTGRHRGVRETQAPLLTFVDDDIIADPGWLQAIADAFQDPSIHFVGGRNLPCYHVAPPAWVDEFHGTPFYGGRACAYLSLLDLGESAIEIDPNYVWGLNFSVRRATLVELDGFHPDCMPDSLQHFQGDGETGLTAKARRRGYRALYQPKALIHHQIPPSRLTLQYFARRAYYQGVCDSYASIRCQGHASSASQADDAVETTQCGMPPAAASALAGLPLLARRLLATGRRWLDQRAPQRPGSRSVKSDVQAAYRAGYTFHQNAVLHDPELLNWVLRKDYWDYRLPSHAHANE